MPLGKVFTIGRKGATSGLAVPIIVIGGTLISGTTISTAVAIT